MTFCEPGSEPRIEKTVNKKHSLKKCFYVCTYTLLLKVIEWLADKAVGGRTRYACN